MSKTDTYIREHRHCEGGEIYVYEVSPFETAWKTRVARAELVSKVDQKARDFALFYYDTRPSERNMKHVAMCYGIKRQTGASHMLRMGGLGFLEVKGSPVLARTATLPRVYVRKVFWSENFWDEASSID